MADKSQGTVLLALAANAGIGVAKLFGGLLSGSSVMLAEAAHSAGDTVNELFLLTALNRGARRPDATHPFGYGKERFFWSLLAAVGIFVAGAVFSLYEGLHELFAGEGEVADYLINYLVLGAGFVLEGSSLVKAVRQTRRSAKAAGRSTLQHVRVSSDPTVKTVVSEDSAAVVGLALAAGGLVLHQLTGNAYWDGAAAIGVGLLLVVVAFLLGRDTKELLIGEAAQPRLRVALYDQLCGYDEIDRVVELLTMLLGPNSLLVAVRADLAGNLSSDEIESFSTRLENELQEQHPSVTSVFLDATRGNEDDRAEVLSREMAELRRTSAVNG